MPRDGDDPEQHSRSHSKQYLVTLFILLVIGVAVVSIISITYTSHVSTTTVHVIKATPKKTISLPKLSPFTTGVDDSIDLTNADGSKMAVTVGKPMLNASIAKPIVTIPAMSDQLVAVQVKIINESTQTLTDAVGDDMTLYDAQGLSYQPSFDTVVNCTPFVSDNGIFTLAPGASITGCEVFEVPKTATVNHLTFIPSKGSANVTGTWNLMH